MNYQGRLTDALNNPLDGNHDFVFGLYDVPSGSTALWTESQNAVPVANGVLAVQLGSVAPLSAALLQTPAVYLQISVDGVDLSPRQRLVSSPYAFIADRLQGRSYDAFVSTDAAAQSVAGDKTFSGNVAVTGSMSVPSPTAAGHAASRAYVDSQVGSGASGWRDDGTMVLLTAPGDSVVVQSTLTIQGTAFSVGGSALSVAAGKAGLGTAAPGAKLDVAGDAQFGAGAAKSTFTAAGALTLASGAGITVAGNAELTGLPATPSGATAAASKAYVDGQIASGASGWRDDGAQVLLATPGDSVVVQSTLTIQGSAFSVGGSTLAVNEGKVGIGTNSPSTSLEVQSSGTGSAIRLASNAASTNAGVQTLSLGTYIGGAYTQTAVMGDTSGADSHFKLFALQGNIYLGSNIGAAATRMVINTSGGVTVGGSDLAGAANLLHVDGSASDVVVDIAGNAGIGTTTPGAKLDVAGDAQFGAGAAKSTFTTTGALALASGAGISVSGSAELTGLPATPSGATAAASKAYVDSQVASGASGWTDDGTQVLLTAPGDSVVVQSTLTVQGGAFSVGGSTLSVAAGRVGVGTTAPAERLEVAGSIRLADGAFIRNSDSSARILLGAPADFYKLTLTGNVNVGSNVYPAADIYGRSLLGIGGNTAVTVGNTVAPATLKGNPIHLDGTAGVGTPAPGAKLDVAGDAQFGAGAAKSTFTAAGALTMAAGAGIAVSGSAELTGLPASPSGATAAVSKAYVDSQVASGASGWTDDGTQVLLTAPGDSVVIQSTLTVQGSAFSVGGSTLTISQGRVGIGTTNPQSALSISGGDVRIAGPAAAKVYFNPAGGTKEWQLDAHGQIVDGFNVRNNTDGVNALSILPGGDIGMGTTAPNAKLQVMGNLNVSQGMFSVQDSGGDILRLRGEGGIVRLDNEGLGGHMAFRTNMGGTVTEAMRLANTGRLGIGISDPAARLHISSANAAAADALLQVSSGASAGQELLVVKGDGRVGVGKADPGAKLDVAGDAQFGAGAAKSTFTAAGALTLASGAGITVAGNAELTGLPASPSGATAAASKAYVDAQVGSGASGWRDDGTQVLLTAPGDSVVVQSTLTVQGGAFSVGGSTLVVKEGNIGLGTTNPANRLDVSGNVGLTGDLAWDNGVALAKNLGGLNSGVGFNFGGASTFGGTNDNWFATRFGGGYRKIFLGGDANDDNWIVGGYTNLRLGVTNAGGTPGSTPPGQYVNIAAGAVTLTDQTLRVTGAGDSSFTGRLGVGAASPGADLDVAGDAQFGAGAVRSTFTAAGALTMASGAGITVAGNAELTGLPASPSGATAAASKAYVDAQVGSGASGWRDDGTQVLLTAPGDNVVVQSTLTVQGSEFSVGGATFAVKDGNVGIGTTSPSARIHSRNGRLLIDNALTYGPLNIGPLFNANNDVSGNALFNITDQQNSNSPISVNIAKFTGASLGSGGYPDPTSPTAYTTNNHTLQGGRIGYINFQSADGTQLLTASAIGGGIDAVRSANSMAGRLTFWTNNGAASPLERMRITPAGSVGVGTALPGALLDVDGDAQFGAGAAKSTFTAAGALAMAAGKAITLNGSGGYITTGSSVNAGAFFGDGSNLTGIIPGHGDGTNAGSGFLCLGTDASGNCQTALVDSSAVSASTSPVQSGALFTHAALAGSSAHSAASANTAGAIVARDPSGDFSAGTITAGLNGLAAAASALAADPADCGAGLVAVGVTASGTAACAAVSDSLVDDSTNAVTTNALYDHNAGAAAHSAGIAGNAATATNLAADPADAGSGFLCLGINAAGTCQTALVDSSAVSASTSPVQSGALFTHAALAGSGAHSAASANTAGAIVARDPSGDFSAGTVTAGLTGAASLNVLKGGDTMTGQLTLRGATVDVSSISALGAVGIGGTGLSNGTLVVKSTSTDAANPVVNIQANNGSELVRVQQDGSVGIGTSNPASGKLQVEGGSAPGATAVYAYSNSDGGQSLYGVTDHSNGQAVYGRAGGAGTGWAGYFSGKTHISGSVGIGTTDPSLGTLQVSGAGDAKIVLEHTGGADLELHSNDGAGLPGLRTIPQSTALSLQDTGDVVLARTAGRVGIGTAQPAGKLHLSSGTLLVDGDAATPFRVGESTFVVTSDGDIGIGTADPAYKLQVAGGALKLDDGQTLNFGPGVYVKGAGNNLQLYSNNTLMIESVSNGSVNANAQLNIPAAGLSVGSGNAWLKSQNVGGSGSGAYLYGYDGLQFDNEAYYGGPITFRSAGAEKLRLTSAGALGLGTTTPGARLEVKQASGDAYAVKVSSEDGAAMLVVNNAGNVGIGTANPDNTYQGLTVYGSNPSVRLKGSSANSWNWLEFVTSGGTNNFSLGVNQTLPYFGIKAGAGLDDPHFAIVPSGYVGIGTTDPDSLLTLGAPAGSHGYIRFKGPTIAEGNIYHDGSYGLHLDTNGNFLPIKIDGSSLILGMTGSVGVGTTAPGAKLDVNGNIAIAEGAGISPAEFAHNTGHDNTITFGQNGGSWGGLRVINYHDGSFNNQYVAFDTHHGGISSGERMRIDRDGNVGIGTTNPTAKLHVGGTPGADGIRFPDGTLMTSAAGTSTGQTSTTDLNFAADSDANGSGVMALSVKGQETMRIANDGNVGIGTTSPARRLHVYRASGVDMALDQDDPAAPSWLYFGNDGPGNANAGLGLGGSAYASYGGGNSLNLWNSLNGPLTVNLNGAEQLRVTPGSSVGIGTVNPASRLHVSSANAAASDMVFLVSSGTSAGQELLVVKGNGRVGVGTDAPSNSLHIRDASGTPGRANVLIEATSENAYLTLGADQYAANSIATIVKMGNTGLLKLNNTGSSSPAHLVVDNAGRIGVGAVPAAQLHVSSANAAAADTVLLVSSGTAAGQELLVVRGNGGVGIGTSNPSSSLHIAKDADTVGDFGAGPSLIVENQDSDASGGAASFRLMRGPATKWAWINDLDSDATDKLTLWGQGAVRAVTVAQATGRVGLGTSAPDDRLHVVGQVRIDDDTDTTDKGCLRYNGTANQLEYSNDCAAFQSFAASSGGGWTDDGTQVRLQTGTDAVVIQSTLTVQGDAFSVGLSTLVVKEGRVGVGTTAPGAKLEVQGAANVFSRFDFTATRGVLRLINNSMGLANTTDLGIDFSPDVGNPFAGIYSGWQESTSDGFLAFKTSNDYGATLPERVRLTSTGNVGIGTTAPSAGYRLDVSSPGASGIRISDSANTSSLRFEFDNAASTITAAKNGAFATSIDFRTQLPAGSLNDTMTLNAGNVGIGTTDPKSALDLSGGVLTFGSTSSSSTVRQDLTTDDLVITNNRNAADSDIVLKTMAASERMRIQGDGNVGIGTTNPAAKLDVDGDVAVGAPSATAVIKADGGPLQIRGTTDVVLHTDSDNDTSGDIVFQKGAAGSPTNLARITNGGNFRVGNHLNDAYLLTVDGDVAIGQGTVGCVVDRDGTIIAGTCISDERLKKDVRPLDPVLPRLAALRPVTYNWRSQEFPEFHFGDASQTGLVAQEVEKAFPELVETDPKGFRRVNYSQLPLYLLQALKEQQKKIGELETALAAIAGR
ncbi:MAG: hypothetical protein A2X36_15070 [Elusimicrobia bacterium GWA2_69_24]|nr:MAG: hypothetical protein A2X36_15070 [Elusimicrobia bacterium GWA2_69_24]